MIVSLALMVTLNHFWPCELRHGRNDLIGWQLSVLGTTYAVILGFMLSQTWTAFEAANLNAELEASALRNVYRLAQGLPSPQRTLLESQALSYATFVVDDDWPAMARGEMPEQSHKVNQAMWRTLMSIKAASPAEFVAEGHALSELSELTSRRRTRLLQSASRLPAIFWAVLLAGGILTSVSVTMFGSANPKLHALQVSSITLLITLAMLAIADVNQPFKGWVHVSDYAFERAKDNMVTE